jgi:hypothetical protein
MPSYPIEISPGKIVRIEADTQEEAFEQIRLDIAGTKARQGAAPYLDDLLFDYDTGVQDLTIRARLAAAEKEDLEMVATKIFGADGFTINSKGQLAATPLGLSRIGEEAEYVEVGGKKLGVNRIVDEDAWFSAGDFADFAGTSGPIVGAVAALTPQVRVLKGLQTMFGLLKGNDRITRTIAAMIGSGGGKAVEESLESLQGLQNQSAEQVAKAVASEAIIGGAANAVGEAIGVGYKMAFGVRPPLDNLRLNREAANGFNANDIIKVDKKLGREATTKELKQAAAKGEIRKYDEKLVVSQQNLGKFVPGLTQAIAERIAPVGRVERNKENLFRHVSDLFADIEGSERAVGNLAQRLKLISSKTAMSDTQKRELSRDIKKYLEEIDLNNIKVTKDVDKHLNEVMEFYIDAGMMPAEVSNSQLGAQIRNSLIAAREGVAKNMATMYKPIDNAFEQMRDPNIAKEVIEQVVIPRVDNALQIVARNKGSTFFPTNLKLGDDITLQNNPMEYLEQTLLNMKSGAKSSLAKGKLGQADEIVAGNPVGFSFKKLRDTMSSLKEAHRFIGHRSLTTGAIDDVVEELSAITTDLVKDPIDNMPSVLSQLVLEKTDRELVGVAMNRLLKANKYSYDVLKPFDKAKLQKTINELKIGGYDVDDIYHTVIKNGDTTDLKSVFSAVRNYDGYIDDVLPKAKKSSRGLEATNEQTLRDSLKQKLVTESIREATDPVTGTVNLVKFSSALQKFEARSPGKMNALFNDEILSGDKFLQVIRQLSTLRPNIKSEELVRSIKFFGKQKDAGLGSSNVGQQFLKSLEDLAESKAALQKVEANNIIQRLPEATTEEVVKKIFTPGAGSSIQMVKNLISPAAFKEIQNNSMNRILREAIDFDGLAKKGDIMKVFKGDRLERTIASYGDETLEAMFGKELASELKGFSKYVKRATAKEAGSGMDTGSIFAAGLGFKAVTDFRYIPVVVGLQILSTLFSSPAFLRTFSGGPKGATAQIGDLIERLVRFTTAQSFDETAENVSNDLFRAIEESDVKKEVDSILSDIKIPPTTNIELPDVNVAPNITSSLSQDPAVRASILAGTQSAV